MRFDEEKSKFVIFYIFQTLGIALSEQSIVYGIRRYSRGAKLWEHTDRVPTHIISAILQVNYSFFKDLENVYQRIFLDRPKS